MLYQKFYERFTLLDKTVQPDMQGGFSTVWSDSKAFYGALVTNSSNESREANKEAVAVSYTVTAPFGTGLKFHDVIRRDSDGSIFRIVSNASDMQTPSVATFQFEQVQATGWELTR